MSEPHTWAEFCAQDPHTLWGQYATIIPSTDRIGPIAQEALVRLLQSIELGAWQRGYRIDPDTVRLLAQGPGNDLLSNYQFRIGLKGTGLLEPSAQQFLVWAELLVRQYRKEAESVKHCTTWCGFLRYQWNLLLNKLRRNNRDG